MLRDAFFIARKDIEYMLRARETILWVFVMPVVFFYFIGTITGGYGRGAAARETLAVRSQGDAGFLFDRFVRRLEERGYRVVRAETDSAFASYSRRLSVPQGFTDSLLVARPVTLRFARSESGMGMDYDALRIRRAMYTTLADVAVVKETEGGVTPQALQSLDTLPRALRLEVTPAGERKVVPSGFQQAVPGIMVMFTLLVLTTSGAVLLVIERRQGLLKRLAYTPIDRLAVVLGKWGGKLALGVVQIAFAMAAGTVLFNMDWGSHLGAVLAVMLAYSGLMASLGLLFGSVARSEGQAAAIGVISANVLAALGGCWWPIEVTPAWMQKVQILLPTGWAMDALHRLVSFDAPPAAVIPHVAVMAAGALVLLMVSTRAFRFE